LGIRDQGSGIRDQESGNKQSEIQNPKPEILWIGGQGGVEEALVTRAGILFMAIPAGGLHGVALISATRNMTKLIAGTFRSLQLISRCRPDVMFTTGGFVSAPVAVACWLRRVPLVVYLPDIEPGRAVKFVAKFAARIGVTTEDSVKYFSAKKVVVTGYPTRSELTTADRSDAIRHFELDPDRKTLLIFGGSKGARSINRAASSILETLLAKYQVIHISGSTDARGARARCDSLPPDLKPRYHLFEYVHEMGLALAAADLVVSRAGASVLGEYPLFGLPSILIAYPYAWRYQRVNADYLVSRGAAVRLDDATLQDSLLPEIDRLLGDEAAWQRMRTAARSLARPDAAARLADVIRSAAGVPA